MQRIRSHFHEGSKNAQFILGTHIHATHFQSVVTYNTINSMYVCILLFLQLIVQWCFSIMLCIISTSIQSKESHAWIPTRDSDTYHFGITWAVSQDHCWSSVITIRGSAQDHTYRVFCTVPCGVLYLEQQVLVQTEARYRCDRLCRYQGSTCSR